MDGQFDRMQDEMGRYGHYDVKESPAKVPSIPPEQALAARGRPWESWTEKDREREKAMARRAMVSDKSDTTKGVGLATPHGHQPHILSTQVLKY